MTKAKFDDMATEEPSENSDNFDKEKIVEKVVKETFTNPDENIVYDNTTPSLWVLWLVF